MIMILLTSSIIVRDKKKNQKLNDQTQNNEHNNKEWTILFFCIIHFVASAVGRFHHERIELSGGRYSTTAALTMTDVKTKINTIV